MPYRRNLPISVFDQICLQQTQVFGIFFEIPRELTSAILQPLSSCEFVIFWGMVSENRDPKSKVVSLWPSTNFWKRWVVFCTYRWWFQAWFGIFIPNLGEMIQICEHIFQLGWETTTNYRLVHSLIFGIFVGCGRVPGFKKSTNLISEKKCLKDKMGVS